MFLLFLKKVSKKFGQFGKSVYLCTRKSDNEELNGSVAQLNRASDYGSEGCGFESRRNHKREVFRPLFFIYIPFWGSTTLLQSCEGSK